MAVRVFTALYEYKEAMLWQRENRMRADLFFVHGLLTKTLKSFQLNLLMNREQREALRLFRQKQVEIYLPNVLA
jgi:hypothetical protein